MGGHVVNCRSKSFCESGRSENQIVTHSAVRSSATNISKHSETQTVHTQTKCYTKRDRRLPLAEEITTCRLKKRLPLTKLEGETMYKAADKYRCCYTHRRPASYHPSSTHPHPAAVIWRGAQLLPRNPQSQLQLPPPKSPDTTC